jgi:hypothetical protein
MANETKTAAIHVFEKAGLGVAPYRFGGMFTIVKQGANTNAFAGELIKYPKLEAGCGTCAFCGHAIMNVFVVVSADGTRWGVGSSCIHKFGAANLVKTVKAAIREKQKARRKAKGDAARAELIACLDEPRIHGMPHSNAHFAQQGKTFADEIQWFIDNAGATGLINLAALAKKKIASLGVL